MPRTSAGSAANTSAPDGSATASSVRPARPARPPRPARPAPPTRPAPPARTPGEAGALAPVARPLLRDDVYARLRDAIVDGTLAPDEQLRDQDLAERLGVSRTPVREALLRLEQSGLVVTAPGRSTRVATVDRRSIVEAQSVVTAMHEVAIRESLGRLTALDLDAMRAANDRFAQALRRGDADAALRADDELHDIPVRVSGNAAVAAVLEQYTPALRRLERLRFSSLTGRASVALHDELIAALERADGSVAYAVSRRTWHTLEPLLDTLPLTPTRMEGPR